MKKHIALIFFFFLFIRSLFADDPIWGHLANPGFENQPIKSVYFFSGNWRNGVQFYDYNPSNNTGLYTLHPSDARHLGWSESAANREFALQTMVDVGANLINMSYWGLPGTDNWAYWAPMQTSTDSHDELFDAALGKNILIAPYIESFAATDDYEGFTFADDFPGTADDPSPVLISFIEDLVDRYIVNPANPQWPAKWARVYDKNDQERYLISIIHVASNQKSVTDQSFAEGFDHVAEAVYTSTGIRIGFALDILPPASYAPGTFKATASGTAAYLTEQSSIVAIQCFIPEIWTGMDDENDLINWKNIYHAGWVSTEIPFIHDISPGYDAHIVFPSSPEYGNNELWRNLQTQSINEFNNLAITFNTWNGFTEGFAAMPTVQYGDDTYMWLCSLFEGTCGNSTGIKNPYIHEDMPVILPNPAAHHVTICINDPNEEIISLKIINSNGTLVKAYNFQENSINSSTVQLNTEKLINGVYCISIFTNKYIHNRKFVIMK